MKHDQCKHISVFRQMSISIDLMQMNQYDSDLINLIVKVK